MRIIMFWNYFAKLLKFSNICKFSCHFFFNIFNSRNLNKVIIEATIRVVQKNKAITKIAVWSTKPNAIGAIQPKITDNPRTELHIRVNLFVADRSPSSLDITKAANKN